MLSGRLCASIENGIPCQHALLLNVKASLCFPSIALLTIYCGCPQLWLGYQQSLRPCEAGLALNVDIACTAFLEEVPVPDYLAKAAGLYSVGQLADASGFQKKRAAKAIVGIKVCAPGSRM